MLNSYVRVFYSLPSPKDLDLKWKPFEVAKAKVERLDAQLKDVQRKRAQKQEAIRRLEEEELQERTAAALEGADFQRDAKQAEREKLEAEIREYDKEEQALLMARPRAEEALRMLVFERQAEWAPEADKVLERAIEEERAAYDKALKLIEGPRHRRRYAESLAAWVRRPEPSFGANADTAALVAIQNLQSGAYAAEERLRERRQVEALQAQQQEEGVA